jgi:hypothetical protein
VKRQVAGRDVVIVVEDTGPGIQEEKPVRIFDPMFSTSGLGKIQKGNITACYTVLFLETHLTPLLQIQYSAVLLNRQMDR